MEELYEGVCVCLCVCAHAQFSSITFFVPTEIYNRPVKLEAKFMICASRDTS